MIRLLGIKEKDLEKVRILDPDFFSMLTGSGDVIRSSVRGAYQGQRFLGAAFLYAGPSYLVIEERKLPVYHLHFRMLSVPGEERQAEAIDLLTDALIQDTETIRKAHPGKRIVLRTWVREEEKALQEFYLFKGFHVARVMPRLVFDLQEEFEKPSFPEGLRPELLKMDEESLQAYKKSNQAAFYVADSLEALKLQCRLYDGKIYVLRGKDRRVLSSVTCWKNSETSASTENVFTIPEKQRQGLMDALLFHVLSELQKEGYKEAELSVFGNDSRALQFYLKRGYVLRDSRLELWYDSAKISDLPLY